MIHANTPRHHAPAGADRTLRLPRLYKEKRKTQAQGSSAVADAIVQVMNSAHKVGKAIHVHQTCSTRDGAAKAALGMHKPCSS